MSKHIVKKPEVAIAYCGAYWLLNRESRTFYATRVEGWAYAAWDLPNIRITSGYAPKGPLVPESLYKDLDERAKHVSDEWEKLQLRIELGKRAQAWLRDNH